MLTRMTDEPTGPAIIWTSFGSPSVEFEAIEGPHDLMGLGRFDLVISKDALQHIPSAIVNDYLDCFQAISKVSLITNDVFPSEHLNVDIEPPSWRLMDIREPPFSRKSFGIGGYANAWNVPRFGRVDADGYCRRSDPILQWLHSNRPLLTPRCEGGGLTAR